MHAVPPARKESAYAGVTSGVTLQFRKYLRTSQTGTKIVGPNVKTANQVTGCLLFLSFLYGRACRRGSSMACAKQVKAQKVE